MKPILKQILDHKVNEVASLYRTVEDECSHPFTQYITKKHRKDSVFRFYGAIEKEGLSVIGELKRQSPSSGSIGLIPDPETLAKKYISGGAAALSVLTDSFAFGGSPHDLIQVRQKLPSAVILRKDFIVDPIQIAETAYLGADAALLIVAIVGEKTEQYVNHCKSYGLDALVEVHNEFELDIAIKAGADIIGVNNRNLDTFDTDLEVSKRLADSIPNHILKVAESGLQCPNDAKMMASYGYDAVLIGESLVRSDDPVDFIKNAIEKVII